MSKPAIKGNMKNIRNRRFYYSVIISIFVIFTIVLILSVATSYISNKWAYSNSLSSRTEYQMANITQNIHSYGTQTVYLQNNPDIIKLLSHQAETKDEQLLVEKKISDDIWNSIGKTDYFVGASLEGIDGTFYLKNTKLEDFSKQMNQLVDITKLDFSVNKYDITIGTYKNDSILIISSPVIDTNEQICGYLHIFLNHLIYGLQSTSANREDYLFDIDTAKVITCDGFANTLACEERVKQSQDLQDNLITAIKTKDTFISYTNTAGEKMFSAVNYSDPFVLLTAITNSDMIRNIVPFTVFHIVISLFLMALLIFLVYLLFNRTTKPVADMIEQCSKLISGEDVAEIGTSEDIDLDKLGKAFNSYRKQLEYAAYSDPLLGIGTRQKYIRDIDALIASNDLDDFCIFIIDIKEFSKYNDVFSIELGDELLHEVSMRLSKLFIQLYRINGDVFLGMLSQSKEQEQMTAKIHQTLENKIIIGSFEFELKCRVGICSYPTHGTSAISLLEKSQSALHYIKKQSLSNTVVYNDDIVEAIRRENEILTLLLRRISDKTLEVWYQPIYHIESKQYRSAEALLRLKDDNGKYLSPFKVISIAEKSNIVNRVGDYVLESACRLVKKLETLKKCDIQYIQVNLSVQELARNNYASKALSLIRSMGIDPSHIGMEITETMVVQSFSGAIETLNELKNNGIRIAMDDFGSGYSGINYLSNLPFDILKLDKDLVAQVDESDIQCEFVKTVIQLAKIKNITTVAEGVEKFETLNKIIHCEVDSIQGYYFSKPLCESQFIKFIEGKVTE